MVKISQKQLQIDKANKRIIVITSLATFIVIFCAVASQALFSQLTYQNRLVSDKKEALSQLRKDKQSVDSLDTAYTEFVGTPQNILGGSSAATGAQNGDNAQIVLDALPSKYDFPALATSLEKLLTSQGVKIQSITGTDDEVAQGSNQTSNTPAEVAMPFQIGASGSYQSIQNLIKTLESSIRPIQIQSATFSGDDSNVTVTISAQTFYQPSKSFTIGTRVVK